MKKILLLLILAAPAFGRAKFQDFCQNGGAQVVTNSLPSATRVQQSFSGATVNIYYTGGAAGVATSSGTTLTWSGGTPFNANSGWVGLQITYNSSVYTIASVASRTQLTTTTSLGSNTSPLPWSMPATAPAAIFSDNAGTVKSNPYTCDSNTALGFFYADDGVYDVRFSGTGITTPFTLSAYPLFDPTQLVNTISVKSSPYNAKCDGSTDDTSAINAAFSGVPPGTTVNVPLNCYHTGTITIPQSIKVVGVGWPTTANAGHLVAASSISTSIPCVQVYGNNTGGINGLVLQDLVITSASGLPCSYGLLLNATSTSDGSNAINNAILHHVYVGPFKVGALEALFSTYADGVFNLTVDGSSQFYGTSGQTGATVWCNQCGDNIVFRDVQIQGPNVGLEIAQLAGTANLLVDHVTDTACAPVHISSARQPIFIGGQYEPASGCNNPSNNAAIDFDGTSGAGVIVSPVTIGVRINETPSTTTYGIRDNYVLGAIHSYDVYALGTFGQYGILRTANAGDVTLDNPANYLYDGSISGLILDQGGSGLHCKLNRFGVVYADGACPTTSSSTVAAIAQSNQGSTSAFEVAIQTSTPLTPALEFTIDGDGNVKAFNSATGGSTLLIAQANPATQVEPVFETITAGATVGLQVESTGVVLFPNNVGEYGYDTMMTDHLIFGLLNDNMVHVGVITGGTTPTNGGVEIDVNGNLTIGLILTAAGEPEFPNMTGTGSGGVYVCWDATTGILYHNSACP